MRALKYIAIGILSTLAIAYVNSLFPPDAEFRTVLNTLAFVVGFCLMTSYLEGRKS